jgi:putative transposase
MDLNHGFPEVPVTGFVAQAEAVGAGVVPASCRRQGLGDTSFGGLPIRTGGLSASDAMRFKELEADNIRLQRMLAESLLLK